MPLSLTFSEHRKQGRVQSILHSSPDLPGVWRGVLGGRRKQPCPQKHLPFRGGSGKQGQGTQLERGDKRMRRDLQLPWQWFRKRTFGIQKQED